MAGRLKKSRPTRRDAEDAAVLKHAGDPAHINPAEDRLLGRLMPEAHGAVVTKGLLAEAGRRGDDRVTKLVPAEAALLRRSGGSGTRNPASGLLEYSGGGMSGSEGNDSVGSVGGPGDSKNGDTMGDTSGGNDRLGFRAYDPMKQPAIESLLAAPSFMPEGMSMRQYSPRDTWGRLFQEYFKPSVRAPGRYGAPSAVGPGIMGTMAGFLTGQPMSAMMGLGAAMGRASSPATQAASAAEMSERGAMNSTGQQQSHDLNAIDAKLRLRGGETPAAETIGQAPPPGFTLNPAGQIVPLAGQGQGDNRAAWKDPAQNLIADYIWRGRQGSGLLGW